MTAKILPFQFKTTEVRTLEINDIVWFVASDISSALQYQSAKDMARMLDDDEKGRHIVPTPGGDQEVTTINESGLYHALIKSRKPEAQPFRRWITNDVLPAIRKYGRYDAKQEITHADIIEAAKGLNADELNQVLGAVDGKRLVPNTLTPAQQRHIQTRVAKAAGMPGNSFPQVYRSIKDRFNVGSYKDVPASRYPELCKYLGTEPLQGELIEHGQLALPNAEAIDYPARGQGWRYEFRDMFNCGWTTELEVFLVKLQRLSGKDVTFHIGDVAGLLKELRTLMHIVEMDKMQLENLREMLGRAAREAEWSR